MHAWTSCLGREPRSFPEGSSSTIELKMISAEHWSNNGENLVTKKRHVMEILRTQRRTYRDLSLSWPSERKVQLKLFILQLKRTFRVILHVVWQQAFVLWQRFSALNSNWGKRTWKRPNWLDNCAWLGISSERLACCGKGTCHGFQSTVGSATTEIRTLRELGLHTFILRT